MTKFQSERIDLVLSQQYTDGIKNKYDVFYFDIYLHDTDQRIGYIDLRVGYSIYLYYLGNIGYRIYEDYRGHGYAYEACKTIFPFAKDMKMDYLYITCNPNNIPSRKTLDKLNGICLGDQKVPMTCPIYYEGEKVKRIYRFDLKE